MSDTTSTTQFKLTKEEAIAAFAHNKERATHFAQLLWIVIGSALVFFLILQIFFKIESWMWSRTIRGSLDAYELTPNPRRRNDDWSSLNASIAQAHMWPRVPFWQRFIRALLAFYRKYFFSVNVPIINISLAELGLVMSYVGFMSAILVIDTPNIPPNPLVPHITVIGIANRAGLLAVASLPFNVLLSNRISLVSILMGVSFDRIQYLHRWVGRTTLALAITHGTCKLIQMDTFGDHSFRRFGLGALCIAGFLMVFSNRLMLQKAYETFIAFHTAAVISFVCLIWFHMPRHKGYLIATIGLWVADRSLRWIRIIFYNSLWRCGRSSCTETATLRLLSHDTTRLEVLKPDFAPWKAGAYAYVSTPGMPWWPQSHPFTIASRPSRLHISHPTDSKKGGGDIMRPQPNLIFLIRARNGWTRKLHKLAQTTASPSIPVIIDGPYDGAPEIHKCFDTVLLFAGGAGISWTLPILVDLVEKARRNQSAVRRVIWVCALRHYVNYDWFFGELEQIVQMSGNAWIDVRIHYTTDTEDVQNVPAFFRPGRPDIEFIIEEAVNAAKGRLFIGGEFVCSEGKANEILTILILLQCLDLLDPVKKYADVLV